MKKVFVFAMALFFTAQLAQAKTIRCPGLKKVACSARTTDTKCLQAAVGKAQKECFTLSYNPCKERASKHLADCNKRNNTSPKCKDVFLKEMSSCKELYNNCVEKYKIGFSMQCYKVKTGYKACKVSPQPIVVPCTKPPCAKKTRCVISKSCGVCRPNR